MHFLQEEGSGTGGGALTESMRDLEKRLRNIKSPGDSSKAKDKDA